MSAEKTDDWRDIKLSPVEEHEQRHWLYIARSKTGWRTRLGADQMLYMFAGSQHKIGHKRRFEPVRSTMPPMKTWRSLFNRRRQAVKIRGFGRVRFT